MNTENNLWMESQKDQERGEKQTFLADPVAKVRYTDKIRLGLKGQDSESMDRNVVCTKR